MRAMRLHHAVLLVLAVGAVGAVGCDPPHHGSSKPDPVIAHHVYELVLCQECDGGERASVVALGSSAVPLLRATLLTGPPPDHIARLKQLLSAPARPSSPPLSQGTIALQIANFDAMYRVRAVEALTAIGTADAKDALCAGKKTPGLRARIYSRIDTALARVGGTCP